MSTKEEVKNKLKKAGFQVADDNAVLTVIVPASTPLKNAIKDVKSKLKEYEYTASFGIKQSKDGAMGDSRMIDDTSMEEETFVETVEDESEGEDSFAPLEDSGQFSLGDFGIGI